MSTYTIGTRDGHPVRATYSRERPIQPARADDPLRSRDTLECPRQQSRTCQRAL